MISNLDPLKDEDSLPVVVLGSEDLIGGLRNSVEGCVSF